MLQTAIKPAYGQNFTSAKKVQNRQSLPAYTPENEDFLSLGQEKSDAFDIFGGQKQEPSPFESVGLFGISKQSIQLDSRLSIGGQFGQNTQSSPFDLF